MKKLLILLLSVQAIFALNLNTLYEDMKKSASVELQNEKNRLNEFTKNKNEQQNVLNKIKSDLKKEEKVTSDLKTQIKEFEGILSKKEAELSQKAGDIGQMFGSLRQTSSDFLTIYKDSFTASQYPKNEEVFKKYSKSTKLPNIDELTLFWETMLNEIVNSGNVSTYKAQVIEENGEKKQKKVTRIGEFAAISDGRYLQYSDELKSLMELVIQPDSSTLSKAKEFEENTNKINNVMIDPTRGTLLSMLGNSPTFMDRIKQGGVVGYIILVLGGIGVLFAIYKMVILNLSYSSIIKQTKNLDTPKSTNSLGKIAKVFYENINHGINELEIKIAEAILKETNRVKKGQSFVKLLAAVTPLLGLLGTVTGMITTFQAITLFGTGDPKLMAGGISTALITTVLGLVTAIPLLFAYTYISSKSEAIVSILEEQSVGMLAMNVKDND
jgi:biopolymer transport protein ExbB